MTVVFDVDDSGTVTDFSLEVESTFTVNPGHSLTVLDDTEIGGAISANGTVTKFAAVSASGPASPVDVRLTTG